MMRTLLCAMLVTLLLAMPLASAETFSRIDPKALPAYNIYNPVTRENARATTYSYEELVALMDHPRFARWNDLDRVCESMVLMFGRAAPQCGRYPVPATAVRPVTVRAYVDPYVPPPRIVYIHAPAVVWTDPVYYPWAPTYEPYPRW